MIIRTLNRDEAKEIFETYVSAGEIPVDIGSKLDIDYQQLRKNILTLEVESIDTDFYEFDLKFSLKLYDYLNNQAFFNETIAGNVNFWRYVCLCVVPDLIVRRHGLVANYFYDKPGRIYLQAMWWFIHMSFQGSSEKTYETLKKLNTDYIVQLVERQGRDGFYLEVSREIVRVIGILPFSIINKKVNGSNLFRRVMIQNTAKQDNYNLTVDDKSKEYVKALFKACKVEV